MKRLRSERGFGLIGSMILMVALLALATSIMTVSVATTRYTQRSYLDSDAMQLADAGIEKAIWMLNQNTSYSGETANFGDGSFTTAFVPIDSNDKYITSVATITKGAKTYTKRVKVRIGTQPNDNSVAFLYAVQVGNGGVVMDNNTTITGSVYSGGNINGSNGSLINGDAFVSGSTGLIKIPTVGHDAHSHTIQSTTVNHDAYYTTLTSSTVLGTKHPGSPDPAAVSFPVTGQNISDWESIAASGGSQGTTNISGTQTLGPKKITGNLTFSIGATLNVTGVIWVTGNVTIANNATVQVDSSLGAKSSVLIADNPADQTSGGQVIIGNNGTVKGSGNSKSFLTLVSTNSGATDGTPALHISNNALSAVFYATQGEALVDNNAALAAVTGYKLHISNNASVTYNAGLASTDVQIGPGGSWTVGSWQEY